MNAKGILAVVCLVCFGSVAELRAGAPVEEPTTQPASAAGAMMTVEQYPRTDGSTSAHPLTVLTACKLTGMPCEWRHVGLHGEERRLFPIDRAAQAQGEPGQAEKKLDELIQTGSTVLELRAKTGDLELKLLRGEATDDEVAFYKQATRKMRELETSLPQAPVHHALLAKAAASGTHGAYVRLINGEADLILECRPPSEDERKLMAEKKVELELTPIALDGFVFLLNRKNPVKSLSREQIHGIYTGRITNWKDVGGPDAEIHAYQRNRNSGSQETMERVVMQGAKMIEPRAMVTETMAGPFNALERDIHGIGYTFYYYHRFMQPNPEVKFVAVHDVMPGPRSFAEGKYAFTTKVFAVTRKGLPADSPAAKVRDWLAFPEGQFLVGASGYTPLPVPPIPRVEARGQQAAIRFKCDQCAHEFTPDPEKMEEYVMTMEMGGAVDCPKCGSEKSCLPMTKCPACGKYYVSETTRYEAGYFLSDAPPPPEPAPRAVCPHCGTDYQQWWRAKREERRRKGR